MTRHNVDEGRGPRRFDPKQRGRDFTRTRSRRKRGQTERTTERRIDQLETWSFLNTSVATQAAATTLIEVVTELPDATYLDIGRQIILRSPAAVHDILYVGMQLPDDTVAWIQWTSIYEDNPNSPEFTWDKNIDEGIPVYGVSSKSSGSIAINWGTSDVLRVTRSTGSGSLIAAGIPSSSNSGRGLYWNGTNLWVCVPAVDKIEGYVSGSLIASSTLRDYWAIYYDSVAGNHVTTDNAGNRCQRVNISTLAVISTFATDCSGPQGIASDSSGNIYVADTGNNRIRKYNSSLTLQFNWGNAGSGDGQFNTPKGMTVDSSDRIYVADSGNNRIQVFDVNGNFLGKFGIGGSGNGEFSNPSDVDVSGSNIDVADTGNNRISCWTRT